MAEKREEGPDMPFWKGLFEWSMKYQEAGSSYQQGQALSQAEREWLEDALKNAMVDLGKRMVDIKEALDGGECSSIQEKEAMLDELQDLVESIDQAKDLSTIGGLSTLLNVMDSQIPSLQWRAAEIIATCAQNNPEVQESFYDGDVMPHVWNLLDSDNDTCRLKALLAVSCLIRGSQKLHGCFSERHGATRLIDMLRAENNSANERIIRKCLQILQYALRYSSADRQEVDALGNVLPEYLTRVIGDDGHDPDVQEAALEVTKVLGLHGVCVSTHRTEIIREVEIYLARMDVCPKEDWGAAEDGVAAAKDVLAILKRDPVDSRNAQEMRMIIP